jgi:Ca-activated chloride channel family protein
MLEFAFPWAFFLLPAPLLVYWLAPPYRERRDSIQVPFFQRLVAMTGQQPGRGAVVLQRVIAQKVMLPFAWLLVLLTLARPEWIGEPLSMTRSARDLMIAVDLSGSMDTRDFAREDGSQVDRLDAVKTVLHEFVEQREHDRLGLILFGDAPFLQAPFTEDHEAWLALLEEASIGMAGQSTVFGDAIGLAIKLFSASDQQDKVLIVLTDGNDTGSKVPPVDAARVAAAAGIRIYAVAVGDPATVGEEALDVEVLQRVAEVTQGGYFQALDRQQLQDAYRKINALEPQQFETLSYRPRTSLHHYPIMLLLAIYIPLQTLLMLLSWRRQSVTVDA